MYIPAPFPLRATRPPIQRGWLPALGRYEPALIGHLSAARETLLEGSSFEETHASPGQSPPTDAGNLAM